MKKKTFFLIVLLFLVYDMYSQIGVSNVAPNNNANHLINNILIGGGVSVSNVSFNGDSEQIGYFSNGNSIGMSSGIVMSSGRAVDADLGGNPSLLIVFLLYNVQMYPIQYVMICMLLQILYLH